VSGPGKESITRDKRSQGARLATGVEPTLLTKIDMQADNAGSFFALRAGRVGYFWPNPKVHVSAVGRGFSATIPVRVDDLRPQWAMLPRGFSLC
jgi:hypothetical protein